MERVDLFREPIKKWDMDKDTKAFLVENDFGITDTGGGCIHLTYKDWIINKYESVDYDDMYALNEITLNDLCMWGQIWNDTGEDTSFLNTLESGKQFVDQYKLSGSQFANKTDKPINSWIEVWEKSGGDLDTYEQNYFLCQWENSYLVSSEKDLIKNFPHDIHVKELGWSGYNRTNGKSVAIDTFWDMIMFIKKDNPFEWTFFSDNMNITLMRESETE